MIEHAISGERPAAVLAAARAAYRPGVNVQRDRPGPTKAQRLEDALRRVRVDYLRKEQIADEHLLRARRNLSAARAALETASRRARLARVEAELGRRT